MRKLRVAEIADSSQTYGGHAYHDCLDTARADRVPLVYPRAGAAWLQLPFIGGRNAINDNSIAFILQYGHFRMLFTGDAGSAAEARFISVGRHDMFGHPALSTIATLQRYDATVYRENGAVVITTGSSRSQIYSEQVPTADRCAGSRC